MGGTTRSGHGKVDQIIWGKLEAPLAVEENENPFLVSRGAAAALASPETMTIHKPQLDEDQEMDSSPFQARSSHFASPPSLANNSEISPMETTLVSPPTHPAYNVHYAKSSTFERSRAVVREKEQRKREDMRRMMDVEDNPFLVRRGETSKHHASPVDETRPTVTYVFRGAKKVFANPFMLAAQPFPAAELHPSNEDFEPHPNPKPKLLWPTGRVPKDSIDLDDDGGSPSSLESSPSSRAVATPLQRQPTFNEMDGELEGNVTATRRAFASPSSIELGDEMGVDEDEEEDEEEEVPVRRGLLFAAGGGKRGLDEGEDKGAKRRRGLRV
jgi:hypothetical protein